MRMMLLMALMLAPALSAQSPVQDGKDAYADGRMEEAVAHFSSALKTQPKNDELYAYRAASNVALGNLDKAVEDIEMAIGLESTFSLTWNIKGYIAWKDGDHEAAVEDYTSAMAYAVGDERINASGLAQIHQNRGIAYQDLGNTDRALVDFNRCVELTPDNPAYLENRGLVYVDKQLFDMAFVDFDRAVEMDKKNARAYVNRAFTARQMGDYEQAVRDYSQALRITPDYGQALIGRGYTWMAWDQPELAKKDFELGEKLDVIAAAQTGLGQLAQQEGDPGTAHAFFGEALKHDKDYQPALHGLAMVLQSRGRPQQANEVATRLCKLGPNDSRSWHLLALTCDAMKQHRDAIIALNRALELAPNRVDSRQLRALAYARTGNFKLAKSDAERAAAKDQIAAWLVQSRITGLMQQFEDDAATKREFGKSLIETLKKLNEAGEDLSHLKDDPDFAGVQTDPEFKKLVGDE